MTGFLVTSIADLEIITALPTNSLLVKVAGRSFLVVGFSKDNNRCYQSYDEQHLLIIDGYTAVADMSDLVDIVKQQNWSLLNTLEGHFSGLLITQNNIIAFNDRYGGKNIYWQYQQKQLMFASQLSLMPLQSNTLNADGLYEALHYRWTTGEHTLISGINKLPIRHHAAFTLTGDVKLQAYWHLPQPEPNKDSLSVKVEQTQQALTARLLQVRERYDKVAIFLSGGVDSSILAALAKPIFKQCYLITPVFKGLANPELSTAKAFAKRLDLPHHLVEINPDDLLADFESLVALKREPLRHYSSLAMMAMMRAIPDGYQAVLYGEAADTLYGSNGIKRVITHYHWKKQTQYIPNFFLHLLKKILPGRGRVLLTLKQRSLRNIILSVTKLTYSKKALNIVEGMLKKHAAPCQLNCWQWNKSVNETNAKKLRHSAQERILNSDAATHFAEAELIAQCFNKHIISPFFVAESITISSRLTEKDYFGDGSNNNVVKPVLRELACKFFPRELIYQKKHGFPVPFIDWLKGPLKGLVKDIESEQQLFDGAKLEQLTIEDDFEIYWLLINLSLLEKHLGSSLDDSTV